MTRLPAENRNVVGLDYCPEFPKYKVGPLCSVPGCSKLADHAHHIWRRSFLTGDYGWVRLENGIVLQNLCALCYMHHDQVTKNEVRIRWHLEHFVWDTGEGTMFFLDPQPRVWGSDADWYGQQTQHVLEAHAPGSGDKCPTCKRSMPIERAKRERAVARKSWTITVPADKRENGAEVLDVLLEEAAKLCGHDVDNAKTKYHTLAFALGMFVMHAEELVADS